MVGLHTLEINIYTVTTLFSNVPISVIDICTKSPSNKLNSGGGIIGVPVKKVVMSGTVLLLVNQFLRLTKSRDINEVEESSLNINSLFLNIEH